MKKLLIPMMAAALVTGLSGTAFADNHEATEAPAATEKAPAKPKGKPAHAKGNKAHAKKGHGSGCKSGSGCHKTEHTEEAPAAH